MFVNPVPDGQTFARMYAKAAYHDRHYEGREGGAYRESARLLRTFLPHGARVLDYGCGVGEFLKSLDAEGLVAFGVEFDKDAAVTAHHNSRSEVWTVDEFFAVEEKPRFDAIHLGDVLEHLGDPANTLRRLLEHVKPGGVVFAEGPIETNPSLVYWVARTYGAIKHAFRPEFVASDAPTHLFRTNARQQLAFFQRLTPRLVQKHWEIYETGWPYADGGVIKRAIARVAIRLGGTKLCGVTLGNRFCAVFTYD
ncbi:MAG: methyltransferase domain-containing protein [Bacteroidetes bacterium]|nr:methyltransferase domain-containing protein [Bacteroidota bacterium]